MLTCLCRDCFVPRNDGGEKKKKDEIASPFYLTCVMVFQRGGCVYIITNKLHTVLYTGATTDITVPVWQHKNKVYPKSFTARYNCNKLVYYFFYSRVEEAIAAENLIKGSSREYKKQLINELNPEWTDLYDQLMDE